MGAIGLDLSFLDVIEIDEPAAKGVRFNADEMYMLKFITYKGMSFSGYVKNLIIEDIRNYCNKSNDVAVGSISKEGIRDIVMEALRENNYIKKENDDEMMALGELGIRKRT